jgi:hypothetical protein
MFFYDLIWFKLKSNEYKTSHFLIEVNGLQ